MTSEDFKAWARGTVRSWTMWFGAVLLALPDIAPLIAPDLKALLDKDHYTLTMRIIGIAVIILRIKTTTSLKEKT